MSLDATKYKLSTLQDTFKNTELREETITVAAGSLTGDSAVLTYDFGVDQAETISQIQGRLSYDSDKWHILPLIRFLVYRPSVTTSMQVFSSYSANNLTITLEIIPVGGGPWTYPAFTLDLKIKVFVMPSSVVQSE